MITELSNDIVRQALQEDLRDGTDITTDRLISPDTLAEGWIEARHEAIVSGLTLAKEVFETVDAELKVTLLCQDSDRVRPLNRILTVSGRAASILKAERTALNFIGHLSGIATQTAELVAATRPWNTQILCTRKTTPGLRIWEVEAVKHGGGDTFRTNLSGAVLIKDNHLEIIGGIPALSNYLDLASDANAILSNGKLEVASLFELEQAVAMGWKFILLDNFTPDQIAEAMLRWGRTVHLEASGGITAENIQSYAATGVHAISIGGLTHSVKSADFALEIDRDPGKNRKIG